MQFEQQTAGDVLVVKVTEARIAGDAADSFRHALHQVITGGRRIVVLDLTAVTFIDSMGLGALIAGLKSVPENGDLVLCGAGKTVQTMLKLTRLNLIFKIYDTAAAAVAALSANPPKAS